jgi:hypothetical protein
LLIDPPVPSLLAGAARPFEEKRSEHGVVAHARANKKDLPPFYLAPSIADMNTPPELREQLRESREENRGFLARLDLIAEIITCQDEEEENEDEDPKEEGDEKEEEEGEEDSEEGDVDEYYLG